MDITIETYSRLKRIANQIDKLCKKQNRWAQLLEEGRSYGIKKKKWERPIMITIGEDTERIKRW